MELTESNPSIDELPGVFQAKKFVAILVQIVSHEVESNEHAALRSRREFVLRVVSFVRHFASPFPYHGPVG